jgi:hypothetical protein
MGPTQPRLLLKHQIEAPSPEDNRNTVQLVLRSDTFDQYRQRSLRTAIAEYYAIVSSEIVAAKHCFRGVKRPMAAGTAMDVDERVIVYTWQTSYGAVWVGSQFDGHVLRRAAPPRTVFVVLVREEELNDQGIYGSNERWNWIEEDSGLPQAPVDGDTRYGKKLWSRT